MSTLLLDLRHALRAVSRQPVGFAAAVISISLGLGAASVLFGVVDALLLRPPAHVRAPVEIIRLYYSRTSAVNVSPLTSFPTYELLRARLTALPQLAAQASKTLVVGRGAEAREVSAEFVSANSFSILGVTPAIGRFFIEDEDRAISSPSVVLGHGFWRGALGGSPNVLGQTIAIGNRTLTVVGVAPARFNGIDQARIDVWLPIGAASAFVAPQALTSPTLYWVIGVSP